MGYKDMANVEYLADVTDEYQVWDSERIQAALAEMQEMIKAAYPTTTFQIYRGEDPEGVYLRAIVDVDDTNDVMDVFMDRLVDIQIEERLPVYVVPAHTPERVARLVAEATRRREQIVVSE